MTRRAIVAAVILCATAAVAHAYPQFQLGKEQVCAGCHISPAGGGLLDGMGPLAAEEDAFWGGNPGFLHGAIELPDWLLIGGDLRAAGGVHNNGGGAAGAAFPMQMEVYSAIKKGAITAYVTVGAAIPREDKTVNALLLREHWVMYRTPDATDGVYVRAGRFMPTYGLRYAEHVAYTRRFGGTPLYGETYALAAGFVQPGFEVHATGFIRDRLRKDFALEMGDGFALYAEKRLGEAAAIGGELRFAKSEDEWRAQGGLTGKYWLAGPKIQISAEAQLIRQKFDAPGTTARTQLVTYLMGSWQGAHGFMVDLGIGHFDEDLKIKQIDRDCVDLNIHWFMQSHVELVLMNRYQMIGLGDGGDSSFYSLLQAHYRI